MEEWRSYTTLSSQEKRKDMGPPSDSLRFVSSPRGGNELTQKAFEIITISTLQRKELEKMRKEEYPTETEEDWLNSLQSWKSKRNSTLERRKDSARDHIKSSLSDSIEKGRESGLGSSLFSPNGESFSSPSSNYVLTNYYSHPNEPEKEKEISELDQVLIQLQLLREKKEKGEQKDVPSRFTPPLSHNVGKTSWTDVNLDIDKKETSNVSATLHYSPREIESMTRVEPPRNSFNESKKLEKDAIGHEKMKKPTRMIVDIGIDDPPSSSLFSSNLRSSYRSSTLNPITPPISLPISNLYPPSFESSFSGGGMRMYGSLPRRKDNDYRVISVDEKKGPGKLTDFVPDVDRGRDNENGMTRGIRRDEEPLLIRNYYVLPISPIANRSQYKTIDDFDPQPMKTIDNYSTLPSKVPIHRLIDSECTLILQWSTPTASQGIGRSAQEWLSVTQRQKLATPGVKKSGRNLVRKEFASELQEKIVKKMEAEEKSVKENKRVEERGINTVSSKKICAHCGLQLGNGSAMIIASIGLSFHIQCFTCSQCALSLDKSGSEGAQVQLDGGRLKCIPCYNSSSLSIR
ncbi:lim-8 [Pristionchus pacificus]|nr:lim-8 [Pristionchus pacificus]